ncbi:hypothetical protein L596_013114 [Steinernema carpocapsae]|uniref:Uncharacterized protein n=1 Tax=Steinernema carpocapsae TaxID=34508 RepID=A0A4U5NZ51_STECR|nr:hypothetical protein L596_013114 [Steinernema carpocapsae]
MKALRLHYTAFSSYLGSLAIAFAYRKDEPETAMDFYMPDIYRAVALTFLLPPYHLGKVSPANLEVLGFGLALRIGWEVCLVAPARLIITTHIDQTHIQVQAPLEAQKLM